MDWILRKYKKYKLDYDWYTGILTLNTSIDVEEFLKLRIDIMSHNLKVYDIRVNS